MPGNIASAAPSSVLPQTLSTAFSESRDYADLENEYHCGERQTGQLAQTSRRAFKLSKRLTSAQLATLKNFFDSVSGGHASFYFYNPYEGAPVGSNYDATGVATTGRHTVRFIGDWSQQTDMQRTVVPSLQLLEVA